MEVPGIGRRTAEAVLAAVVVDRPGQADAFNAVAFNPETGEVVAS